MGNRTTSLDKPIRPSSLARSDPTPDRPTPDRRQEEAPVEKGTQAKTAIIKVLGSPVLGSPKQARKTSSPQDLAPLNPALATNWNESSPIGKAKPSALKRNAKFAGAEPASGAEQAIEARPARGRNPQPHGRDSKRGSIGPGSRSPSRGQDDGARTSTRTVSTSTSTVSTGNAEILAAHNAAVHARDLQDAQEAIRTYKASVCELFQEWEHLPELDAVDSFLSLETEPTHYMRRLFSLADELKETGRDLDNVMSCGAHFLWSCRHEPNSAGVKLEGTLFEGGELEYFKHLQSFFKLVSNNLGMTLYGDRQTEVGKVVDFRDTEVSRKVTADVEMLQKVYDKIFSDDFKDF